METSKLASPLGVVVYCNDQMINNPYKWGLIG